MEVFDLFFLFSLGGKTLPATLDGSLKRKCCSIFRRSCSLSPLCAWWLHATFNDGWEGELVYLLSSPVCPQ